jgi:hypothetical protein
VYINTCHSVELSLLQVYGLLCRPGETASDTVLHFPLREGDPDEKFIQVYHSNKTKFFVKVQTFSIAASSCSSSDFEGLPVSFLNTCNFLLPSSIEPSNSVLDELKTKITIAVEYCTEDLVIFPRSRWDLGMNIIMGIVSLP